MSNTSVNTTPKATPRLIFINLLIVVFIIMNYFYISELFGSVSTPFISNDDFALVFGFTLLVFTFFSILAGSIPAFVAGFLGELLFQLASYGRIYLDWCLVVAIFGLVAGIYKYKPLKYQNKKDILFTFFVIIADCFIVMLFVISSHLLLYTPSLQSSSIFINFGLKFFIGSVLSTLLPVPILLIIYDISLASKERHLYYLLLTHHPVDASDHTFYFQFGRTKIYLCSRCSGIVLGVIMANFFVYLLQKISDTQFSPEIALLIVIIFPIPGLLDWGTQKLQYRKSTTGSRLFTGFIIGVAAYFISLTGEYYFLTLIITTVYFSILFLLMFIGQRRMIKEINRELNQEVEEDYDLS